jgi:NAD(P)-dependent dehydrogenase (short-subunit alcohol dehydrogenase family)
MLSLLVVCRRTHNSISSGLTIATVFPSELSAPLLVANNGAFPKTFIPLEKTGDEQDMAGTILYLASRAGAYLNGLILVIDGGRLTLLPNSY